MIWFRKYRISSRQLRRWSRNDSSFITITVSRCVIFVNVTIRIQIITFRIVLCLQRCKELVALLPITW